MKASDNVFPRLLISEGGSTSTPASGNVTVYAKANGLLYSKDDAGAETALGGGSGSVATDAIWDAKGDLAGGTGANTAARLAVGSNGQVLTADSGETTGMKWAASGSGALVLLEQYTASSSATLDFTSISSTYDTYIFEFLNVVPASNAALYMRMGTGGGPTWDSGANYSTMNHRSSSGGAAEESSNGASQLFMSSIDTANTKILSTATNFGFSGSVTLITAGYPHIVGTGFFMGEFSGGIRVRELISGAYESTTALTGIRFLMSTGNIASGIIRLYGVVK